MTKENSYPSFLEKIGKRRCRSCDRNYHQKWRATHSERVKEYAKKYAPKENARLQKKKWDILKHYSSKSFPICARCGFVDIRALSIDHINGGGNQHTKSLFGRSGGGASFYKWLIRTKYPEGYQVLCMNCQFIKRWENREVPVAWRPPRVQVK